MQEGTARQLLRMRPGGSSCDCWPSDPEGGDGGGRFLFLSLSSSKRSPHGRRQTRSLEGRRHDGHHKKSRSKDRLLRAFETIFVGPLHDVESRYNTATKVIPKPACSGCVLTKSVVALGGRLSCILPKRRFHCISLSDGW